VLRVADEGAPRHVGNEAEAVLGWRTGHRVVSASYSIFVPGGFVRATGAARTIHMIGLKMLFSR